MSTLTNISDLRTKYMSRITSEFMHRLHVCKRTALTYIYAYIEQIFATLIPCDNNENLPWNEALSRACEKGIPFINIPIIGFKESISCDNDYINIVKGNFIMDQAFLEPIYIGGAPTLQTIILAILGEGFTVDINISEQILRISIQVL